MRAPRRCSMPCSRPTGPASPPPALAARIRQLDADPTEQPWLLRAMLTRAAPRTLVGRIGFHAPPDARGALEIGYAVEPRTAAAATPPKPSSDARLGAARARDPPLRRQRQPHQRSVARRREIVWLCPDRHPVGRRRRRGAGLRAPARTVVRVPKRANSCRSGGAALPHLGALWGKTYMSCVSHEPTRKIEEARLVRVPARDPSVSLGVLFLLFLKIGLSFGAGTGMSAVLQEELVANVRRSPGASS